MDCDLLTYLSVPICAAQQRVPRSNWIIIIIIIILRTDAQTFTYCIYVRTCMLYVYTHIIIYYLNLKSDMLLKYLKWYLNRRRARLKRAIEDKPVFFNECSLARDKRLTPAPQSCYFIALHTTNHGARRVFSLMIFKRARFAVRIEYYYFYYIIIF